MTYIVGFHCDCGYGPFFVCDNRDAPIPMVIPPSIVDDNGEGEPHEECRECGRALPTFEYVEHGIVHYVNEMLRGARDAEELHAEVGERHLQAAERQHQHIERAVEWIEAHPTATSWGRRV